MKSFTLASFAVMAALYSASSAYAAPQINCMPYQGNWVSAPPSSCATPDFSGSHSQSQTQTPHPTQVTEVDVKN